MTGTILQVIAVIGGLFVFTLGATAVVRLAGGWRVRRLDRLRRRMLAFVRGEAVQLPWTRGRLCLEALDGLLDLLHRQSRGMRILRRIYSEARCARIVRRRLRARAVWKRAWAAHYASVVLRPDLTGLLIGRLEREHAPAVIRQLVFSLTESGSRRGLTAILEKLSEVDKELADWIRAVLPAAGGKLADLLEESGTAAAPETVPLICKIAPHFPRRVFREQLLEWVGRTHPVYAVPAAAALARWLPESLLEQRMLEHPLPQVRRSAIDAVGISARQSGDFRLMYELLEKDETATAVLIRSLNADPGLRPKFEQAWFQSKSQPFRERMSSVLAGGIEQYLPGLAEVHGKKYRELVVMMLCGGHTAAVISFLNRNRSEIVEDAVTALVAEAAAVRPELARDFARYLDDGPLKKTGLVRYSIDASRPPEKREEDRIRFVRRVLAGFGVAALFLFGYRAVAGFDAGFAGWVRAVVLDYSALFVWYSMAISAVYLLLLFYSARGARFQNRMRRLHSLRLLFQPGVLPRAAVLAPAYNEAASIVESTLSLLDLHYPDYRLIVINDGSRDETLERLKQAFKLYRVDQRPRGTLQTAPVRGVYRSSRYDRLLVVDKENGGKADSLNAGINFAEGSWFCGIDADSLLERDALLQNAAVLLDYDKPVRAVGGNILPVNGCRVQNGRILEKKLPPRGLPRLQTVEYLRAFMASRIGWAHLNSLLIISGAFGFFHRATIEAHGGYLTGRERYHQDTVGEDMELVVRTAVSAADRQEPARIAYCAAANCWTEVPHELRGLGRQRDRWQRGLIEILSFHRKVLFRARYGRTGWAALPWFFVFEMCGSVVEFTGYLFFIAGLITGAVGLELVLLLLTATLMLGTWITLLSQLISETVQRIFSFPAILRLQLTAFLENFGYRQLNTWWRVAALWHSLRGQRQWDQPSRRGFSSSDSVSKRK